MSHRLVRQQWQAGMVASQAVLSQDAGLLYLSYGVSENNPTPIGPGSSGRRYAIVERVGLDGATLAVGGQAHDLPFGVWGGWGQSSEGGVGLTTIVNAPPDFSSTGITAVYTNVSGTIAGKAGANGSDERNFYVHNDGRLATSAFGNTLTLPSVGTFTKEQLGSPGGVPAVSWNNLPGTDRLYYIPNNGAASPQVSAFGTATSGPPMKIADVDGTKIISFFKVGSDSLLYYALRDGQTNVTQVFKVGMTGGARLVATEADLAVTSVVSVAGRVFAWGYKPSSSASADTAVRGLYEIGQPYLTTFDGRAYYLSPLSDPNRTYALTRLT